VGDSVLIVEDDPSIRAIAGMILERDGLEVASVGDGAVALARIRAERFQLVLLDVMLPGLDGFEVCRQVRLESSVPIVMLTARDGTTDVVAGLELGADDYVTKPFEAPELLARVKAVLRRSAIGGPPEVQEVDDLTIDRGAFTVKKGEEELDLSSTEFRLLVELVDHAGQVLTREALLRQVWQYDYLGDSRLVDMAIKRLRDKIGDRVDDPRYITTVRRVGYRFERT
jgi:DNA-binding response OmpR family regulator